MFSPIYRNRMNVDKSSMSESYLETRWCKRNFKVHGNWWSRPLFLCISFKQFNFGGQLRLLHASHTLNPFAEEKQRY